MAKVIKKNKGGKTTKDNKVEKIEVEKAEKVEKIEVEKAEKVEKIEVEKAEKIEVEKAENKLTLAEELSIGKDLYDADTIQGCLNRILRIHEQKKSMGERYSFFPIKDIEAYRHHKTLEANFWVSSELDFSKDKKEYEALSPELKHFIDMINAFFAGADGIVIKNISFYFLAEVTTLEESAFYILQQENESVHGETYGLIINTLIDDEEKRNKLFLSVNNTPCITNKALWAEKYMKSPIDIQYRRVAFACLEGINFISGFLGIFYFRSKGVLQNIILANEFVAQDEGQHMLYAVMLYRRGERKSDKEVTRIIREAVELELEFIDVMLPNPIDDLTPKSFKDYVKHLGNRLSNSLGHPKIWAVSAKDLPEWMIDSGSQQKTNFYEGRVASYKKFDLSKVLDPIARIKGSYEEEELAFSNPTAINFIK